MFVGVTFPQSRHYTFSTKVYFDRLATTFRLVNHIRLVPHFGYESRLNKKYAGEVPGRLEKHESERYRKKQTKKEKRHRPDCSLCDTADSFICCTNHFDLADQPCRKRRDCRFWWKNRQYAGSITKYAFCDAGSYADKFIRKRGKC